MEPVVRVPGEEVAARPLLVGVEGRDGVGVVAFGVLHELVNTGRGGVGFLVQCRVHFGDLTVVDDVTAG